jgi:hypothetical protein
LNDIYSKELLLLMYESGKMRSIETIPGMGGGGLKENDGGGEFNYDVVLPAQQ